MAAQEKSTLAILGGGQLGMLLCEAAEKIGINTLIVTPDAEGPAVAKAGSSMVCSMEKEGLATEIATRADIVTYELEDIPSRLLETLAHKEGLGDVLVRPATGLLSLLKNKATQKQWYADNNFPSLPYFNIEDPYDNRQELLDFGFPFVQKAQTGGYDGYGVQVIADEEAMSQLWDVPSVIERYVERPLELGVVVARSVSGDMVHYQPVRMEFDHDKNILDAVIMPTGLSDARNKEAVALAKNVIEKLDGVGVFAVEMFLVNDALVINETSPRVHNSGHHTLETSPVSQFEQHVRAVCDLPLLDPGVPGNSAIMANLLYSDELEFLLAYPSGVISSKDNDVHLYWYGKKEGRPGRKMGHVTCLGADLNESKIRTQEFIQHLKKRGRLSFNFTSNPMKSTSKRTTPTTTLSPEKNPYPQNPPVLLLHFRTRQSMWTLHFPRGILYENDCTLACHQYLQV